MNFYEHHIGDYDEATAHLSACEDGIYSRLIRKYYATERPLIADVGKLQRLVRARTKEERDAVVAVLEEFFHLEGDGWHQDTCDEVIAAYQVGEPEREVKKANEDNRMRRYREERAALFKVVTGAGEHLPWNVPMNDLRAAATRISNASNVTGQPLPATAPATPATATQSPLPSNHKPEIQGAHRSATTSRARAEGDVEPDNPAEGAGTRYGLAAKAMRQRGCAANPGDPRLRRLVDEGASIEEFEAVAGEAADKGKTAPWALQALVNRRAEAAATQLAPRDEPDWRESRDAVSARGQALGVGAWPDFEQDSIRRGKAPSYAAYRGKVIAADQAAGGAP